VCLSWQARERKKAYMYTLENTKKETENRVAGLEQQVNKLERENFMLRQVRSASTPQHPPWVASREP
jgi:hypothetical protein